MQPALSTHPPLKNMLLLASVLALSFAGCKRVTDLVKEEAKDAAAEELKPINEEFSELKQEVKKIDLGTQEAKKQLDAKMQQAEKLAQELKNRQEEIEAERREQQRKIELELQQTKKQLADQASKDLQEQKKKIEQEATLFAWLRTVLILLAIITAIKIFAKPLWRVIQTLLIRSLAPAPRRIFNVPAK